MTNPTHRAVDDLTHNAVVDGLAPSPQPAGANPDRDRVVSTPVYKASC